MKRKLFIVAVEAPELVVYALTAEEAAEQARDAVSGFDYKYNLVTDISTHSVRPYNGLPCGWQERDLPWGEDVIGPDGKELTIADILAGKDREPDEPEPRKPLPGQIPLLGET